MDTTRADKIIEHYGKFSPMSQNEAGALAKGIVGSSPINREEAERLLGASALFSGADLGWRHIVTQEVQRHVLEPEQDTVKEGAEDWLIATLATTNLSDVMTLDLVQSIMTNASNATERLGRVGLRSALGSLKSVVVHAEHKDANTA